MSAVRLHALLLLSLLAPCLAEDLPRVADFTAGGPGNLAWFAAKVRAGKPVTVAFIGGSITVGSGASAYAKNYYWQTRTALATAIAAHGGGATTFMNAGIGGTGSTFAAYRVGVQVLDHHPDLLVVEFAVNDCPGDPAQARARMPAMVDGMEGIVRQALGRDPQLGIVLLYTSAAGFQRDWYAAGTVTPSVAAHHRVAQRYGLCEVLTGGLIDQGLRAGTFTAAQFFPDGTHPSDIGHTLYATALSAALVPALDLPASAAPPAVLPAPLGDGALAGARLAPVEPRGAHDGWTSATSQWNWYGVPVWSSTSAGQPLRVIVTGRAVKLIHTGRLQVDWLSGGTPRNQVLDGRADMPFPASWTLPADAPPDGGELTITALPGASGAIAGSVWGLFSLQ